MQPHAYNGGDLAWFVGAYIPNGWCKSISNVAFVPMWIYDEYDNLAIGVYNHEAKWYEREAIETYFGRSNEPR